MTPLKVSTTVHDIVRAWYDAANDVPPDGAIRAKGFETESPDGTYKLMLYVNELGEVELQVQVRPENSTYDNITPNEKN